MTLNDKALMVPKIHLCFRCLPDVTGVWPWPKSDCVGFVNYLLTWTDWLVAQGPPCQGCSSPPHSDQQKEKRSASSPGSCCRAPPLKKSCQHQSRHTPPRLTLGHVPQGLTPSTWESLTSVSSPLRLSGSVLVMGSRRTGWPETAGSKWFTNAGRTQYKGWTQSWRSCTADEGALWSTQWLHAGSPGQDLHPEPAVILHRDLWWRDRPSTILQQLSPSSFSCI